MKNYLKIILIGAASFEKDGERYGGQWSNMKELISDNVSIFAADPQHKEEPDRYIRSRTGVSLMRGNLPNVYNLNVLNVYSIDSIDFFENVMTDPETFYLVLSFTGIERENPSWLVAKKLGAKNKFFWDTKNALFLSFGCLTYPPNIKELMNILKMDFTKTFDSSIISKKLWNLIYLQNAYYAFQNNIDALSRAYTTNLIPEWSKSSIKKLRHIDVKTLEDAHNRYLELQNYRNIGISKLIRDELLSMDLLKFWDERPNDFF